MLNYPRCFATSATVLAFRVLMGLLDLVRYSVLGGLEYWLGEVLDGPMYLKMRNWCSNMRPGGIENRWKCQQFFENHKKIIQNLLKSGWGLVGLVRLSLLLELWWAQLLVGGWLGLRGPDLAVPVAGAPVGFSFLMFFNLWNSSKLLNFTDQWTL